MYLPPRNFKVVTFCHIFFRAEYIKFEKCLTYTIQNQLCYIWAVVNHEQTGYCVRALLLSRLWNYFLGSSSFQHSQCPVNVFSEPIFTYRAKGRQSDRTKTSSCAGLVRAVNTGKLELTFLFVFSSSKSPLNCQPLCCFSWAKATLATQNSPL